MPRPTKADPTTVPEDKRAYLIMLDGGGDNEFHLVNQATWTWITTPTAPPPERVILYRMDSGGTHPKTRERALEYLTQWDTGSSSPDNDRALGVGSDFDIDNEKIYEMAELLAFAAEQQLVILDTFTGDIY